VCGYAANLEKATSKLTPVAELEPTGDGKPELIHTPGWVHRGHRAFLKMSEANDIKCVAYMAKVSGNDEETSLKVLLDAEPLDKESWTQKYLAMLNWQPVAAFLRGDHFVNETKLLKVLGATSFVLWWRRAERLVRGPAATGPIGSTPPR